MRQTWFDRWVARGDYTGPDLGMFRIIYSFVAIVFMPNYLWITRFDDAFYQPPPGPLALLNGFPPSAFFVCLDIAVAIALFFVTVGLFTRTASVALSILLLVGEGFAFSFGKIDHSFLFVAAPAFMAIAGWGDTFSLDARRSEKERVPVIRQWALRAFALTIGIGFITAALPKIRGGWLSPSTQAAYAYEVQRVERGRSEWLATPLSMVHAPLAWEAIDWATVVLEFGLIFTIVAWRSWRLALAAAVLFHVGVLLTLNIDFWMNIVAYGAFVRWSQIWPKPAQARSPIILWPGSTWVLVGVAALVVAFFGLRAQFSVSLTEPLGWVVVLIGGVLAMIFIVRSIVTGIRAVADGRRPVQEGSFE